MRFRFTVQSVFFLLVFTSSASHAAVTATFDNGSTDYPGTAGNGWAGAWFTSATASNSAMYQSGIGSGFGPLGNGTGNYLQSVYVFNGSGYHLISRPYTSSQQAGLDTTKPHVIKFQFRLDSSINDWQDVRNFIQFDDDVQGNSYFSTSQTWSFGAASLSSSGIPSLDFVADDGNGSGGLVQVDTGIVLAQGTTYNFTITTNPSAHSWDFSIDNGTTSFERDNLGWINDNATVGGYLRVGGYIFPPNDQTATRRFDIDSISISQVPELPSLRAILGIGCLVLLSYRRVSYATNQQQQADDWATGYAGRLR